MLEKLRQAWKLWRARRLARRIGALLAERDFITRLATGDGHPQTWGDLREVDALLRKVFRACEKR